MQHPIIEIDAFCNIFYNYCFSSIFYFKSQIKITPFIFQASDSVRQSNASTIYVQDEETTTYIQSSPSRTTEHENMAYVQDDEPRND